MFKRKPNNNINVIYKSSEEIRRAVDNLYTRKSDRNKAIISISLISLFIGIGIGWYFTVSNTFNHSVDSVVKIEVADTLKAQTQSAK